MRRCEVVSGGAPEPHASSVEVGRRGSHSIHFQSLNSDSAAPLKQYWRFVTGRCCVPCAEQEMQPEWVRVRDK